MTIDDIALSLLPGINSRVLVQLLDHFGSAAELYRASRQTLSDLNLPDGIQRSILSKSSHASAEKEVKYCRDNGIKAVCSTDEQYPRLLKEVADYPHVLYFQGDRRFNDPFILSVVGTRKITPYGRKMCELLIGQIAAACPQAVIVSGLAYGTDICAHRTALSHGLRTIGVSPMPLPRIYPSEHHAVAAEMIRRGGNVLTPFDSNTKYHKSTFAARNRVIAGISAATLIIEAAAKSGSRMTATLADGYNRTVMAVAGRTGDTQSEGCNLMIKTQKAVMVESAEDIFNELGWERTRTADNVQSVPAPLTEDELVITTVVRERGTLSVDDIITLSSMDFGRVYASLCELEIKKILRALPGNMYELY